MLGHVPAWAEPAHVIGRAAERSRRIGCSRSSALDVRRRGVRLCSILAEHATPEVGLALLPAPTVVAVLFAVLWGVAFVEPSTTVAGLLGVARGHLSHAPFFVAEGVWVVHRLAGRFANADRVGGTARRVGGVILPGLAALLATLGWTFHLVRMRAFEPILGDVKRSAARPRLRNAFAITVGMSALFAVLEP